MKAVILASGTGNRLYSLSTEEIANWLEYDRTDQTFTGLEKISIDYTLCCDRKSWPG